MLTAFIHKEGESFGATHNSRINGFVILILDIAPPGGPGRLRASPSADCAYTQNTDVCAFTQALLGMVKKRKTSA